MIQVETHDLKEELKDTNCNGLDSASSMNEPLTDKANLTADGRRRWKKPKGKPKRPLTAYNIFFKCVRENIICDADIIRNPTLYGIHSDEKTVVSIEQIPGAGNAKKRNQRKGHGKISFGNLARNVASKWKAIDKETRAIFEQRAILDKLRYTVELEKWTQAQKNDKGNIVSRTSETIGDSGPSSKALPVSKRRNANKSKAFSDAIIDYPLSSSSLTLLESENLGYDDELHNPQGPPQLYDYGTESSLSHAIGSNHQSRASFMVTPTQAHSAEFESDTKRSHECIYDMARFGEVPPLSFGKHDVVDNIGVAETDTTNYIFSWDYVEQPVVSTGCIFSDNAFVSYATSIDDFSASTFEW